MKNVKSREKFINEEFQYDKVYTKDVVQSLLQKVKKLIPQERIDNFIEENEEQVKKVADMLSDENGDMDLNKVTDFINKNK